MNDWKCEHAPAGCNYPEGECLGACEIKNFEPFGGKGKQEPVAWLVTFNDGDGLTWYQSHVTEIGALNQANVRGGVCSPLYTHPAPAVAVNEQFAVLIKKANDQAEHFEREWYLRGDELEALEQVNAQLLEALKELMYARTDKAEGMADAAIAQAEAAKKGVV